MNPWEKRSELPDTFEDLDAFGGEQYKAEAEFRPGLESLPNGEYEFTITDAAFSSTRGGRILKLGLKSYTGKTVEWVFWLNRQEALNRLSSELKNLGFDVDNWGNAHQRPLSVELPKAVAQLPGMQFRGTKTSRKGSGTTSDKVFHDLFISLRIKSATVSPGVSATPGDSIPF